MLNSFMCSFAQYGKIYSVIILDNFLNAMDSFCQIVYFLPFIWFWYNSSAFPVIQKNMHLKVLEYLKYMFLVL